MIVNIGFKINAIIIESLHYCVIGLLMVFSFCSCVTNSKVSNDEQISVMVDSLNVYKENKDGRAMILVLDSLKSFNIYPLAELNSKNIIIKKVAHITDIQ